ncbi:MAG: NAD(P)H-dependent glycerol-3-phosphate dehydrogenase [Acidobacteriota bacterium]
MGWKVKLAVIGGGSWGTALAIVLAPRTKSVRLWIFEEDLAERMQSTRENAVFLPGYKLPAQIEATSDLRHALTGADIVLSVMPSKHARRLYHEMLPHLHPNMIFVSATKGFDHDSLLRISEVINAVIRPKFAPRVTVLSGPSFAREVAHGDPTAIAIASNDPEAAAQVQAAFSGPVLRLYTNADPIGVEVGAALKNVIAIAAGICHGLGLGNNTQAALITRGLAEITRLAVAMGGQPMTLAGLAGLGDLVLTCGGGLSRNRKVGLELAAGKSLADITGGMRMIAEGVETCDAAVALADKFNVDLPIIRQMHAVLHSEKSPQLAVRELMDRALKSE